MSTQKYIVPSVIGASKVSNEIIMLESQISSINEEINSLKEQANKLKQDIHTPQYAGDVKQFGKEVKSASQTLVAHQPQIEMIEEAIANLQSSLPAKTAALAELKKEQIRQQRLTRLDEGRGLLRQKINQVEELAKTLADAYFELKTIQMEHDVDFKAIYPPSIGSQILGRSSFVNFHNLMVPTMFEEVGLFVVSAIPFDVFAQERQAQQQADAVKWATQIANAETSKTKAENNRKLARINLELEGLQGQLGVKNQELQLAQATKEQWQQDKGPINFDRIDSYISRLNAEASELQNKIATLETSVEENP